jgi:hypothetical protein
MSDLFDAPETGAPRAGGVSVAEAASRDRVGITGGVTDRAGVGVAGVMAAVLAAGGTAAGIRWPMGLAPQRPADADPEDEDADDLDDDLDDDEDDEDDDLDDLDDLDDDEDEDEDDDFDDEDEDLDDDLDDDLVDLDDEYDTDDDDDRAPGRPDYENE